MNSIQRQLPVEAESEKRYIRYLTPLIATPSNPDQRPIETGLRPRLHCQFQSLSDSLERYQSTENADILAELEKNTNNQTVVQI